MRRRASVIAWCASFVVLASCGGGGQTASSPGAGTLPPAGGKTPDITEAATATAAKADGATVKITSPKDGATVRAGAVTVEIEVKRFKIADSVGGEPKGGDGHVYYYLDVDEISTKRGQQATVAGEGRYAATTSTSYTWPDVTPGEHKLGVQLVDNTQRPLQPAVIAEITIAVGR
jgi:hypothetical protein